jgi:hypothetical protein
MKVLRGLFKLVFSRTMLCVVMIALQIYILIAGMFWFRSINQYIYIGLIILSVAMIIVLLNSEEPVEFKTSWILLCCIDPFLGLLLYNFTKLNAENRKLMKHLNENVQKTSKYCKPTGEVYNHIKKEKRDFQERFNNYKIPILVLEFMLCFVITFFWIGRYRNNTVSQLIIIFISLILTFYLYLTNEMVLFWDEFKQYDGGYNKKEKKTMNEMYTKGTNLNEIEHDGEAIKL